MRPPAFILTVLAYLNVLSFDALRNGPVRRAAMRNDTAAASLASIGAVALGVAAVIVGAVVSLILLSNLFPAYSGAVGNLSENMTTADWGDATANSIAPTFGMLIALGGLFAIVGLAFVAYKLNKGN